MGPNAQEVQGDNLVYEPLQDVEKCHERHEHAHVNVHGLGKLLTLNILSFLGNLLFAFCLLFSFILWVELIGIDWLRFVKLALFGINGVRVIKTGIILVNTGYTNFSSSFKLAANSDQIGITYIMFFFTKKSRRMQDLKLQRFIQQWKTRTNP